MNLTHTVLAEQEKAVLLYIRVDPLTVDAILKSHNHLNTILLHKRYYFGHLLAENTWINGYIVYFYNGIDKIKLLLWCNASSTPVVVYKDQ